MNVSVLIATYGADEWRDLALARALPSAEALEGEAEIVLWHEVDGSLASTRNEAARAATADWLLFLDADDELDPGYLVAMRKTMRLWNLARRGDLEDNPLLLVPAVQVMAPKIQHRAATGEVRDGTAPAIPAWDRSLLDLNCACIGTLIPTRLFLRLGGFRELASLEDWDLWLRAVKDGARMVATSAVYRAHVRAGSRNEDQSLYYALRREHGPGFDWANVAGYKVRGV